MRYYLLSALLLIGCGCNQEPIRPEAQLQVSAIASSYKLAHEVEKKFCGKAKLSNPCIATRKIGYDVEAAIATANGERTSKAIQEAWRQMGAYEAAVETLL